MVGWYVIFLPKCKRGLNWGYVVFMHIFELRCKCCGASQGSRRLYGIQLLTVIVGLRFIGWKLRMLDRGLPALQ